MALPPINVFSHRVDLAAVAAALRGVADEVTVRGSDDRWTELVALGPKSARGERSRLTIGYDPAYFQEPNGSRQRAGMANYFAGFPATPHKAASLDAIRRFQAIFSFPDYDLDLDSDDPRLEWLAAMCEAIDGVIFTPGALLDARGRRLITSTGEHDPDAQPPAAGEFGFSDLARSATPEDLAAAVAFDTPDEDDEDDETPPPDAQRVARRAMVLATVANRGLIENESDELENPDEIGETMLAWLEAIGALPEAEPAERVALRRPVGELPRQAAVEAVWRIEGLGVLLWALGLYELPRYDELVTPRDLFEAVKIGDEDARLLIDEARLRPREELDAYGTHALMVHWRLRDFSLRPQAMNFREFSRNSWIGAFDLSPFEIVADDVAFGGDPIAEADPELVSVCRSVAMERHQAINWLRGYGPIYSRVETHT